MAVADAPGAVRGHAEGADLSGAPPLRAARIGRPLGAPRSGHLEDAVVPVARGRAHDHVLARRGAQERAPER